MSKKIVAAKKEDKMIDIGEITGAHGIKGQIKVASLTDFPEIRFATGAEVYVSKLNTFMTVTQSSVHKGLYLLQLDGLNDRDKAQDLLHSHLQIDKNDLQELPEGEYYCFQLIGLKVYEDDNLLGTVVDVQQTGANDVYHIKTPDGSHKGLILLPALKTVVMKIDLENGKMQVKVPEGLLDL
ncbi:MAG: ribosome maturation factor RimM [Bacillota bacterium]|jgi:16S rRNA processing protein RimM